MFMAATNETGLESLSGQNNLKTVSNFCYFQVVCSSNIVWGAGETLKIHCEELKTVFMTIEICPSSTKLSSSGGALPFFSRLKSTGTVKFNHVTQMFCCRRFAVVSLALYNLK